MVANNELGKEKKKLQTKVRQTRSEGRISTGGKAKVQAIKRPHVETTQNRRHNLWGKYDNHKSVCISN